MYIYMYIYRERQRDIERERERERKGQREKERWGNMKVEASPMPILRPQLMQPCVSESHKCSPLCQILAGLIMQSGWMRTAAWKSQGQFPRQLWKELALPY